MKTLIVKGPIQELPRDFGNKSVICIDPPESKVEYIIWKRPRLPRKLKKKLGGNWRVYLDYMNLPLLKVAGSSPGLSRFISPKELFNKGIEEYNKSIPIMKIGTLGPPTEEERQNILAAFNEESYNINSAILALPS